LTPCDINDHRSAQRRISINRSLKSIANLDSTGEVQPKPFVIYHHQTVVEQNKGLNPSFHSQAIENKPSPKKGRGEATGALPLILLSLETRN